VERVIGIDDVRQHIAMLRTPDGHGRIELAQFHTPNAIESDPKDAPANTLGIRRVMFAVDDIDHTSSPACATTVPSSSASWWTTGTSRAIQASTAATGSATSAGRRASSSGWPSSSADGRRSDRAPTHRQRGFDLAASGVDKRVLGDRPGEPTRVTLAESTAGLEPTAAR
jgi:hypothetical protein